MLLHLQHIDRKLRHRQIVGILWRREVGNISVHKQLPRIQADDFVRRHSTVPAPDPQVFRRLLVLQALEKASIGCNLALRPCSVVGLQVIEHRKVSPTVVVHGCAGGSLPLTRQSTPRLSAHSPVSGRRRNWRLR